MVPAIDAANLCPQCTGCVRCERGFAVSYVYERVRNGDPEKKVELGGLCEAPPSTAWKALASLPDGYEYKIDVYCTGQGVDGVPFENPFATQPLKGAKEETRELELVE